MSHPGRLLLSAIAIVFVAGCGGGGGNAPAMLTLSQSSVMFSVPFGGQNPAATMVNVSVTGGTAMTSFTAASDQPWLSVTPGNGTAPDSIQISAVLGTLTTANYTGHITVTASGVQGSPATVTVTFTVGGPEPSNMPFWAQWGANPQHTGRVPVAGQSLAHQFADIVYDPFVVQEQAEWGGGLLAHYQAPIVDGNDVYLETRTGTYRSCSSPGNWQHGEACGPNTWNTIVWNETRFSWENGQLIKIWSYASDWKPEPASTHGAGIGSWEPVFHAAEANNFVYVPGGGGTLWKVNKADGTSASHINPFSGVSIDVKNTFIAGPLTADANGNIYYSVVELADPSLGDPWRDNDAVASWLVKVTPQDKASVVSFANLVPDAPPGTATTCPAPFFFAFGPESYPFPPTIDAVAPTVLCGSQRPVINVAPVVSPIDGTIYTVSKAHFALMEVNLIAVNPDLTLKWNKLLRDIVPDGCGVRVPISGPSNTDPNSCRFGSTFGVDPQTNFNGSATIFEESSASPTALPDGSILFGAMDFYDFGRGHLFKFDSAGKYLASYDWGWDTTPAVYPHDGTYSILTKDNGHAGGNYCTDPIPFCAAPSPPPNFIVQVNANMEVEWEFESTNTESCTRNPDGSLTCVSDHPNGFEWCTNMPAIDRNGTVYVNSEDGNVYELPQPPPGTAMGTVITQPGATIFLTSAVGAAYTPLVIGPDGRFYTQNDGHLFVVGN